jgi:integrase
MASDPTLWAEIEGFDVSLLEALRSAGLSLEVPMSVVVQARPAFARAWLEVSQVEEASRSIAASILTAAEAVARPASQIVVAAGPTSYVPRADDRTVAEVIEAYRAEQGAKNGKASTDKAGAHIFRALKEVLGPDKPVRSITRDDAIAVKAFLQRVPTNASKIYPGASLAEAIDLGQRDGRVCLSTGSVRSYVIAMSTLFNWAVKTRRFMDFNPAIGLAGPASITIERRGFDPDELVKLFNTLKPYRDSDQPSRFWVPALCLGGARLGEICQLKTSDVKTADGIVYLDLSLFHDGVRSGDKSLKNRASVRAAPIHPLVIDAGLPAFVAARIAAGDDRLFPELRFHELNGYAGEFSKWFGRHLTSIGLSDRTLVFHSLRHLFREKARDAGLTEEVADAIGGWTAQTTGRRYGRQHVGTLNRELARIRFEGLTLT